MRRLWPVVWIVAVLPLLGWWTYGLFDLDEGFYGAIVAEMSRRGEWITPYFNGKPWFEKPILLYWLAKPSYMLFGPDFGLRLPSILATLATMGLIAWSLRRNASESQAQMGVLAYATCLLPVAAGRMMLTDPILVMCLTGTFVTFWESLTGDRRWRIASAAFLGLSVLAKGPVGGGLFLVIAGVTYARQVDLRPGFRGAWLLSTVAFALIVSTWYVPAYLISGQVFVQKFLIEQNLNRFTGGDAAHTMPPPLGWLFYVPILLLGTCPWVIIAFSKLRKPSLGYESFLATWFWVIFVFFTISSAKLPHYVLPCVAPIAMLAAIKLGGITQRRLTTAAIGAVGLLALAQWIFSSYYYGITLFGQTLPGFHAEVHSLTKYVKAHKPANEDLIVYQMGRREKELGTGKPKIQETTHPSIYMYLDNTATETDDLSVILQDTRPVWLLTRWNRLDDASIHTIQAAGKQVEPVNTPVAQDMYRLYRITAKQ